MSGRAYLASRGVRTLALRLERASASAARLAERLDDHPADVDQALASTASMLRGHPGVQEELER